MAARGRAAGFQMGAEHRLKIANSNVLSRLIKCAEGNLDMASTELQAAITLLDRVMPKLAATDLTTDGEKLTLNITIGGDADS